MRFDVAAAVDRADEEVTATINYTVRHHRRDPESPVTEEQLIAYCKERLAGFKAPESVGVGESIPRTATGKTLRR